VTSTAVSAAIAPPREWPVIRISPSGYLVLRPYTQDNICVERSL